MTPHHCRYCGDLLRTWHERECHIDLRDANGGVCHAPTHLRSRFVCALALIAPFGCSTTGLTATDASTGDVGAADGEAGAADAPHDAQDALPPCYTAGPAPVNGMCGAGECFICQEIDPPPTCARAEWCATAYAAYGQCTLAPGADLAACCCAPGSPIDAGVCPSGTTVTCDPQVPTLTCPRCCYAAPTHGWCTAYDAGRD